MTTIDEQIAYAQQLVNDGKYPEYARGIFASLEKLKRIHEVQVPDEPEIIKLWADGPTVPQRQIIDYIDTLRDLLKRIVMEGLK
jgi:hypothetical protein